MSAGVGTVVAMRIVHTSDWHLGRTLHGVDLLDHQAAYLDHLVELVRAESVEAVVVAGDVYDRAIPPVEAVQVLSDAVARLAEHAAVVLTPGNHDSAVRLGFAAPLLRAGVHLVTRVPDVGRPVALTGRAGEEVLVYALPYLDPDVTRGVLAPEVPDGAPRVPLARSHEAVVGAAMARVAADAAARGAGEPGGPRALVAAHAFVVGGEASDSERDIRVGGVDNVPAGLFAAPGLDYVALGHLHGAQRIATAPGGPVARYSGSPLAYSFSELRQRKSTVLLDVGPGGLRGEAELVPAPVPRRLAEVRGTLEEVLGAAGEGHEDDWVRVVVTDTHRPAELVARVRGRFPHVLQTIHEPAERAAGVRAAVVAAAADPLAVTTDFVRHVTGAAPDEREQIVLREALEGVLAGGRSA